MTSKEIIELLKEQIQASNKREAELLARISELTARISSLEEALLKKGESLGKQQRIAKGLAKLVSCRSEKQHAPLESVSDEERERKEQEKAAARKDGYPSDMSSCPCASSSMYIGYMPTRRTDAYLKGRHLLQRSSIPAMTPPSWRGCSNSVTCTPCP